MDDRLRHAVQEYLMRQVGWAYPIRWFQPDGTWIVSSAEKRPCCRRVHAKTRAKAEAILRHCRTIRHMAELYHVAPGDLRHAVRTVLRDTIRQLSAE